MIFLSPQLPIVWKFSQQIGEFQSCEYILVYDICLDCTKSIEYIREIQEKVMN